MLCILIHKKGQTWYFGFIISIILFTLAIVMYYTYFWDNFSRSENNLEDMLSNAKSISTSMVTSGIPIDWNASNVQKFGLTDGNQRINDEKLTLFFNSSYNDTKKLFGTRFDYWVFFENKDGDVILIDEKEGFGKKPSNQDSLVKIVRLVVMDSKIVRMVIYLWD